MIPIFKPYMPEGISSEIEQILYSGNLAYGKYGKIFETELQKFVGNERIISVSTYNQAMLIVLSTLGLKPGDEVIASPVSCLASNQPFAIKGLKVVWADINPKTGSLDPEDVERRITSKTKAIFHNHYCGYLGDIEAISNVAKRHGLFVVDDSIEAFGATYKNKQIGNVNSDVTVFSFQTVRIPNTIDGAAITFNNEELYQKAKRIRDYGIDRTTFRDARGEISAEHDITLEGYGALMGEINSYIGIEQLKRVGDLLAIQSQNAKIWDEKISLQSGVESLSITKDTVPNYWVYGILCEDKNKTIDQFRSEGWYATGVHINNNIYSVFQNKEVLKGVNDFMDHYVALPCGWWI